MVGFSCEQKALKEKGIDEILEEARESNRENDLEHLKRGCELLFPPLSGFYFFCFGEGLLNWEGVDGANGSIYVG